MPFAALSVPGIEFDPRQPSAAGGLSLGWRYRFDLPYTDEVNALAQLPNPEDAAEASAAVRCGVRGTGNRSPIARASPPGRRSRRW
ncbi:MAG: hypothetical protein R3F11_09820 [Verrucomicrobiales bacterium]